MKECEECTLGCKLLETHGVPSKIEEYCTYCSLSERCSIYSTRSEECRTYQCMWSQMDHVGNELRPDKCNIIFDRIASDIICARLEEGKKISNLVMGQLNSFINDGFSVVVFRGKDRKDFLSKNHTTDYITEKINDSSRVH